MKKFTAVFLLSFCIVFSGYSQTKKQDIYKLLEITNATSQAEQMIDLMMPNFIIMLPDVPLSFWTVFKEKLDLNGLIEMLVPVYDKHFSHDDIKKLIQFYESPIGKKLLEVTPAISQEAYKIGEAWGQKIGLDVINELIQQGYLDN